MITDTKQEKALDLVWGAKAISLELNIKERRAFALLESGQIPAKKIAGRWAADRNKLRECFTGDAA